MNIQNEPVIIRSIIQAVAALFALFVAFGLDIKPEQQQAIITVLAVVLPLAFAFWTRRHVTPTANPRDSQGRQLVAVIEREQWSE